MAMLRVVQAGPLVSFQDKGRFGLLRFGVPASGPMDRGAARAANAALGNRADTVMVEVSLGGLTLDCTSGRAGFAVAGGGFAVTLNGVALTPWCVGQIAAGDRLTIRPGRWGRWAYLAFKGGVLQVPKWLGSAATHVPSGLGGGMVVSDLDMQVQDSRAMPRALVSPVWARPSTRARPFLRISLGPQDRFFDLDAQMAFIRAPFQITDAADRMGVRLAGPKLVPTALDMPSEAIVRGSVQVSGDGVATVLMADHQTTGGYPKIATILSCDTDAFAQMRAHDVVRFRQVTSNDTVAAARMMHRAEQHYLAQIGRRESWVPNI